MWKIKSGSSMFKSHPGYQIKIVLCHYIIKKDKISTTLAVFVFHIVLNSNRRPKLKIVNNCDPTVTLGKKINCKAYFPLTL